MKTAKDNLIASYPVISREVHNWFHVLTNLSNMAAVKLVYFAGRLCLKFYATNDDIHTFPVRSYCQIGDGYQSGIGVDS